MNAKNYQQVESQYQKILQEYIEGQHVLRTKSQETAKEFQEQVLEDMSKINITSAAGIVEEYRDEVDKLINNILDRVSGIVSYEKDIQTANILEQQRRDMLFKIGIVSEMIELTKRKQVEDVQRVKDGNQASEEELDQISTTERDKFQMRLDAQRRYAEETEQRYNAAYEEALAALEYNFSRKKVESEDQHKRSIHELNTELDAVEAGRRREWSANERFLEEHEEQREQYEQQRSLLDQELQERTQAAQGAAYAQEKKNIELEKGLLDQEYDNRKQAHQQLMESLDAQEAVQATQIQELQSMVQQAFVKLQELSVTAVQ